MRIDSKQEESSKWRRKKVLEAIASGTRAEKLARLRRAGIIDDDNQLRDEYKAKNDDNLAKSTHHVHSSVPEECFPLLEQD